MTCDPGRLSPQLRLLKGVAASLISIPVTAKTVAKLPAIEKRPFWASAA
jgi:hypothetical protein